MKLLAIVASVLFSLNVFAHCPMDFSEVELCADITWIDGPNLGKTSEFQINFWQKGDMSHTPVSPEFDVHIYPWMIMANGHNHGGPNMTYEEVSVGVYEVLDARFFMGHMKGYWEVRVDLTDEDGKKLTAATKVNLEGNGNGGHHH